jgi:hypothetical protein
MDDHMNMHVASIKKDNANVSNIAWMFGSHNLNKGRTSAEERAEKLLHPEACSWLARSTKLRKYHV